MATDSGPIRDKSLAKGELGTPSGGDPPRSEVTRLLWAWKEGDECAFDRLFPLVYEELRQLAQRQMARELGARTLQPTALVHESYLRLVEADVDWEGRSHFLAIAARVMRRILVDAARERSAEKRGSGFQKVSLENEALEIGEAGASAGPVVELLALDQALNALAEEDERRARIIELRLFAGLTIEEVGKVLKISHATVERDARVALAWLRRRLARREQEP